uniref:C1q domain-containing protein n=2 Tax=Magallana gigas TaxID=29159 RepID=A0A8W8ILZ3_MAGGI|nr:complement C1q-like protein 4 [Crassostrea gigas]
MCLKAVFVVALQSMLFVSANYSNENVEIFHKLSELENKVSVLTGKLESCKCSTSEDDSITREGRAIPEGRQSQIAFHVRLTHNIVNLGIHQSIEFDKVLLNDGNGYSIYSGHFVAPVSGLYVFAWTISSGDHHCIVYDVVKNNEILVYFISDANDHRDWAVSSGTAVTRMNAGDRVWIRVSNIEIYCSHYVFGTGLGTSSFAGYLIN